MALIFVNNHAPATGLATISCTHVQVCNAIQFILGPKTQIKVKNLIKPTQEDPHHFEPSVGDIKAIQRAASIVLPPDKLQPWLKNIKTSKQSFNIKEQTGHFWLSHQSLCRVLKELAIRFNSTKKVDHKNWNCLNPKSKLLANKFKNKYFILLHDSLGPYFKEMNLRYFALRGHSHLDKISTQSLKKLHSVIKEYDNEVVWIIEKQIHIPHALNKYILKSHKKIKLNTLGRLGSSPFEVLNQLEKEMRNI
jgi:ABC-type Zn uptake system ZnuABC Zn-binding protein ZnuA